jgi:hypothetical protein
MFVKNVLQPMRLFPHGVKYYMTQDVLNLLRAVLRIRVIFVQIRIQILCHLFSTQKFFQKKPVKRIHERNVNMYFFIILVRTTISKTYIKLRVNVLVSDPDSTEKARIREQLAASPANWKSVNCGVGSFFRQKNKKIHSGIGLWRKDVKHVLCHISDV